MGTRAPYASETKAIRLHEQQQQQQHEQYWPPLCRLRYLSSSTANFQCQPSKTGYNLLAFEIAEAAAAATVVAQLKKIQSATTELESAPAAADWFVAGAAVAVAVAGLAQQFLLPLLSSRARSNREAAIRDPSHSLMSASSRSPQPAAESKDSNRLESE